LRMSLMLTLHLPPRPTLLPYTTLFRSFVNRSYLAPPSENLTMKRSFSFKPDRILISLGIVGFCSMATEGAMFDWSGVYFHDIVRSEEHTSELQSRENLVCRLLLEKKKS